MIYLINPLNYFQGGLVCEKLLDLIVNEPVVIMEEGFPNAIQHG